MPLDQSTYDLDGKTFKQAETKSDLSKPSLEGLVAWLETQNPSTVYCYADIGDCLYHRYLTAIGMPVSSVGGAWWTDLAGRKHPLPGETEFLHESPSALLPQESPRTFGAALTRARAILASRSPSP